MTRSGDINLYFNITSPLTINSQLNFVGNFIGFVSFFHVSDDGRRYQSEFNHFRAKDDDKSGIINAAGAWRKCGKGGETKNFSLNVEISFELL